MCNVAVLNKYSPKVNTATSAILKFSNAVHLDESNVPLLVAANNDIPAVKIRIEFEANGGKDKESNNKTKNRGQRRNKGEIYIRK